MGKTKLKTLGDIETKLSEIIPKVGDFVFVIESSPGIADPRKREVLFKNRYGVLCEWQEEVSGILHFRFFEFEFNTFRIWQNF